MQRPDTTDGGSDIIKREENDKWRSHAQSPRFLIEATFKRYPLASNTTLQCLEVGKDEEKAKVGVKRLARFYYGFSRFSFHVFVLGSLNVD